MRICITQDEVTLAIKEYILRKCPVDKDDLVKMDTYFTYDKQTKRLDGGYMDITFKETTCVG